MRFLVDVCAHSPRLIEALQCRGHQVRSVVDVDRRALDDVVLAAAVQEDEILLTLDKDFGELVIVKRLPHPTIVRFIELSVDEQIQAVLQLVEDHAAALLSRAIVVVSRDRIRIRTQREE